MGMNKVNTCLKCGVQIVYNGPFAHHVKICVGVYKKGVSRQRLWQLRAAKKKVCVICGKAITKKMPITLKNGKLRKVFYCDYHWKYAKALRAK